MPDIDAVLSSTDGVGSFRFLEAHGVPRREIERRLKTGSLDRVRQGWAASQHARPDAVQAVRVGGVLTCQSVLRRHGVWCNDDRLLHVRVGKHTTHLAAPHDRRLPLGRPESRGVRLHRTSSALSGIDSGRSVDSIEIALMHLFVCESKDNVIVALDSVLNKRLVSPRRLDELMSTLPKLFRSYLPLADPAAQSGLETKARLGLRRLGIAYRSQVFIDRVGHVDLLVGDRLVLEVDGEAWHSGPLAYSEDRRRDLELLRQGFIVIRVSYAQVMGQWATIEEVVRSLIARREHVWVARHRRAGLLGVRMGGEGAIRVE